MIKRIRKIGGSCGVLIPKIILKAFGWSIDEPVNVDVTSEQISITRFSSFATVDELKKELGLNDSARKT